MGGELVLKLEKMLKQKIKVKCKICLAEQPHISGMRNHYDSKHPKEDFPESTYEQEFGSVKKAVKPPAVKTKNNGAGPTAKKKGAAKGAKAKNDLSLLDGY